MEKSVFHKSTHFKSVMLVFMSVFMLLFSVISVQAAGTATQIRLDKTTATVLRGKSFSLKATVTSAKDDITVTWKSSNPKIATVSQKGKVKVTGVGTATITAATSDGKKAYCKVTGKIYTETKDYVYYSSEKGIKKYRRYCQYGNNSNYLSTFGCVTTSVAIAASGLGMNYTPKQIHEGSVNQKYSERYAMKMQNSLSSYGKGAISVKTAAQIFKDMGLKAKPVYTFTVNSAVKQMTQHLKEGKTVLIKANNNSANGIRVANGHHALVLFGLDEKGNGLFLDPASTRVNYAHGSGHYFKMNLEKFVKYHMTSCTGDYKTSIVLSLKSAGGYILVG